MGALHTDVPAPTEVPRLPENAPLQQEALARHGEARARVRTEEGCRLPSKAAF